MLFLLLGVNDDLVLAVFFPVALALGGFLLHQRTDGKADLLVFLVDSHDLGVHDLTDLGKTSAGVAIL